MVIYIYLLNLKPDIDETQNDLLVRITKWNSFVKKNNAYAELNNKKVILSLISIDKELISYYPTILIDIANISILKTIVIHPFMWIILTERWSQASSSSILFYQIR